MADLSTHRGGLGMKKHFDPQNLNFLIADRLKNPDAKKLAVALSRAQLTPDPDEARKVALNLGVVKGQSKYEYDSAWWGDQEDTPHCTAFAAMHNMADGPVTHPGENPLVEPHAFFEEIRQIDVSEGRDYGGDGATSLAMCKALLRRGFIKAYYWGYTIDDLVAALLSGKPCCLGIDWYTGMDTWEPKTGIIRASGYIRGGHEIEANGINIAKGLIRVKQSWGRKNYGLNGHAYLPIEDGEKLINAGGDVSYFDEVKLAA